MTTNTGQWQRARRPEQIEERRAAILHAAAALLDEEGLEGTGLNAIARTAGISKASIYRYFESREAVLLQLLVEEWEDWIKAYVQRLHRLTKKNDVNGVARAFASTIAKRRRLCVLLAAVAGVLEHNVSEELVIDFKRQLSEILAHALAALGEAVPKLLEKQVEQYLAMQIMAASGMWPHCHPAPVVAEVLAEPEFAYMRFDFESTIRAHGAALLQGFLIQ